MQTIVESELSEIRSEIEELVAAGQLQLVSLQRIVFTRFPQLADMIDWQTFLVRSLLHPHRKRRMKENPSIVGQTIWPKHRSRAFRSWVARADRLGEIFAGNADRLSTRSTLFELRATGRVLALIGLRLQWLGERLESSGANHDGLASIANDVGTAFRNIADAYEAQRE